MQPDSGGNLGDTGITGRTRLNGMVIDLKLGGQTWQLHLCVRQRIQAENCEENKENRRARVFFILQSEL